VIDTALVPGDVQVLCPWYVTLYFTFVWLWWKWKIRIRCVTL